MKHESMPTQRHKEKRVEERASVWERDRERERERVHTGGEGRERERAFGSYFYVFPSPWACPTQIGLARSAVCST